MVSVGEKGVVFFVEQELNFFPSGNIYKQVQKSKADCHDPLPNQVSPQLEGIIAKELAVTIRKNSSEDDRKKGE